MTNAEAYNYFSQVIAEEARYVMAKRRLQSDIYNFIAERFDFSHANKQFFSWFNQELSKKQQKIIFEQTLSHLNQKGNKNLELLIVENKKKGALKVIGTRAADLTRRAGQGVKKAKQAVKKAKQAVKKKADSVGSKTKIVKQSERTRNEVHAIAQGVKAKKEIASLKAKQAMSSPAELRKAVANGQVEGMTMERLNNLSRQVARADKIAKRKGLNVKTTFKVKKPDGDTIKVTAQLGDQTKKAMSLNKAAENMGSTARYSLSGALGLRQIAAHVGPSFYKRLKAAGRDFFAKPGDLRAALRYFKTLGRKAIGAIKRNPMKSGFLGLIGFGALGYTIYKMFKGPDDPEVPPEVVEVVESDPEEVEPPAPDVGPVTPSRKSKCAINNRLVKNITDLGGSNLKERYKDMQSNLHAAGYANLMPKTFSDGVDKPDGICGPETISAITQFQKDNPPLKVDGLYGPLTHAKMKEVLEKKTKKEKNKDNEIEWRLNKIKELEAQLKPAEAGPDGEIIAQANADILSQIKTLKQQIAIFRGAKLQTIDQTSRTDIDKNIERFDAEIAKLSKLIFKLQEELDAAEQAGDEDEAEALQNRISNLSKKLANLYILKSNYEKNQKKLKPPEPVPAPAGPVTSSGKTKKVKITKKMKP
mgnify:CR=1 FL=1